MNNDGRILAMSTVPPVHGAAVSHPVPTNQTSTYIYRPLSVIWNGQPPAAAQHSLFTSFTGTAVDHAIRMRLHPRSYVRRVINRVDVTGSRLHHNIRLELSLPNDVDLNTPVIVPIATGTRNDLRDDSQVAVDAGTARRLTSAEEMQFGVAMISAAYRRVLDAGDVERRHTTEYFQHLELLRGIPYGTRPAALVATAKCVRWIHSLQYVFDVSKLESLITTCLFFAEKFVVLLAVRDLERRELCITWHTDQRPAIEPAGVGRFRRILGRRPYRFDIPLTDVTDAWSYHVFVDAPTGQHIHSIDVSPHMDRDASGTSKDKRIDPGKYRKAGLGTDQAHVYFSPTTETDVAQFSKTGVKVQVSVGEVLPGSILPAMLPTALLFVIALLVTLSAARDLPIRVPAGGISASAAFPAFLLVLPGVASLAFRPQDSTALITAPLISAVSPLVNALCSFTIAVAYLAATINPVKNHEVFYVVSWSAIGVLGTLLATLTVRAIHKVRSELPSCPTT